MLKEIIEEYELCEEEEDFSIELQGLIKDN